MANVEIGQQPPAASRELAALQDMSELAAGGADFDGLFRTLLDKLMDVFSFQLAAIYLLDPQEEFIRGYIARGDAQKWIDESVRSMKENDILCYIAKSQKIETIAGWSPLFHVETYDRHKHSDLVRAFCPISDGSKTIGVLEVGYRREIRERIEGEQVKALRAFLNLVEAGLQKISRNEAILHELELQMNVVEPEIAPELLVRKGIDLLDADRGCMRLVVNDMLEPIVWLKRGEPLDPHEKPLALRKGRGIVGHVWQTGRPYNCMDSSSDLRFHRCYEDEASEIAAPILTPSGDVVVGILNFTSSSKKHFNYRSEQLLRTLAVFASNVMDRRDFAMALQQIDREAERLNYIDFLKFVVQKARLLIGASASFTFWELDETTDRLRHIDLGLDDDVFRGIEFPAFPSITGKAIGERKPIVIYNIWEEPWSSLYRVPDIAEEAGFQSLLSVPIILLGHLIGAINIHTKQSYRFDDREQNRMLAFAREVAAAIETNRHVQEVNNLKEMIRRTAGVDLNTALEAIAKLVREVTRSDSVSIFLLRDDGPGFLPAVRVGLQYEVKAPRPDGGTMKILQSGKHRLIENADDDPLTPQSILQHVQSYIGLLIASPEENFGVIYIDFFQPRRFPERFRDHLEVLADQASLVIESMVLRDRSNREKERVYRAAVDKVAADTAHMLGNELSPVATRVYSLRKRLESGKLSDLEDLQRDLDRLYDLVRNARTLIREVQDYSGHFRFNPRNVSLGEVVAKFVADTVSEPNIFHIEDQDRSWIAPIDESLMAVVFRELVQNTLDMANGPAEIRIKLGDHVPDPRGKFVKVIYGDDGPGVPDQFKERIFEKFFSRRPGRTRGTGLGLHYVRRIIGRHGGEIAERGKYGEGAEFHITLPLTNDTKVERAKGGERQ